MTFAGMLSIFGLQLHVASGSARAEPLNDFDWHKPCISTTSAARVDNGDGTWSFELDPQFDVSVVLTSRAIEWVYDRQQRFPYEPIDPSGPVIVTGSSYTSSLAEIQATEMHDNQGRIWRVHQVDVTDLAEIRAEHQARVQAIYADAGEDVSVETFAQAPDEPDPWLGEIMEFEPESWTKPCTGDKQRIWNGESRTRLVNQELSWRQQATNMVVVHANGESGTCSGVQINSNTTLTAAHCLRNAECVEVCKFGNNQSYWDSSYSYYWAPPVPLPPWWSPDQNDSRDLICRQVRYFWPHPDFWFVNKLHPDFGDDIAVLRHGGSSAIFHAESMELGTAADDKLEAWGLGNIGYPQTERHDPGESYSCARNAASGYQRIDGNGGGPKFMYDQWADVAGTPGKRITSFHDGGPGQSGSPLYYCPGGGAYCHPAGAGLVAGIWGGWIFGVNRRGACKINSKLDWIQAWDDVIRYDD